MQETLGRFLGQEDPLDEGMVYPFQYSCPENPKDRGAWRLQPMGSKRVGHNLATKQQQRVYDFSSVAQSCLTLCNLMDCSMLGFPVHHQLLELAQTHVHRVGDAIQPSHPLSVPSPLAFNLSQHQGLFQ